MSRSGMSATRMKSSSLFPGDPEGKVYTSQMSAASQIDQDSENNLKTGHFFEKEQNRQQS